MPFNPKKLKKFLVNFSLFSISLIIGMILLECALRIIFPVYDPRGMLVFKYYPEDDVELCLKGFTGRLWKNTGDYNVSVKINRYGFRDEKDLEYSTYDDIFVLGDSMGLGWGVEQDKRFSDLLQAVVGISVYNISVPSGDADTYENLLNYAQKKGAKVKNLILSVCMENDLRDYDEVAKKSPSTSASKRRKQQFFRKGIFRFLFLKVAFWLSRNSATYHACASLVHQNDFLCRLALRLGWIRGNDAGMNINRHSDTVIASTLKRLLNAARQFNAVFVIIPSRSIWTGNNRVIESKVHERFSSLLKESGADIVDLRDDFERTARPLTHYFKNDGHLNEKGHLAIASALLEFYENRKNHLSLGKKRVIINP